MLLHRSALGLVALALALCSLTAQPVMAGPATDLVEQFNSGFIAIVKTDDGPRQPSRYQRLSERLSDDFHLTSMMEKAIGAKWLSASERERERVTDAFLRMSVSTYLTRFETYAGEYFQTLSEDESPDGCIRVKTKLIRPGSFNVPVTYIVQKFGDDLRIVDLIFVGGASEMTVKKSEFANVLGREGIPGLTARLNEQASKLMAQLHAPGVNEVAASDIPRN